MVECGAKCYSINMKARKILKCVVWVILGVVAISVATCAALVFINGTDKKSESTPATEPVAVTAEPQIVSAKSRILFGGTTFWGRRTNKLARASSLGVAYPFAKLDTLNRSDYDAWIMGLECPITNNGHNEYDETKLLKFNCDQDYLPEAKKWFTAMMIGTNHTDNQGADGFEQTKTALSQAGIQYFGHYDYTNSTENCGVIVLPIKTTNSDGQVSDYKMPMGFCSAHGVFGIPTEAALQNIKTYATVLPTIVMPHMGKEYQSSADQLRTNLFHKMIDYGADMVLADHPHWIQNSEAYEGKLIVYSMGNFMFDQSAKETTRSAAIDITANFGSDIDYEAWNKLGESCLADRANCFENIKAAKLPKISVNWSNFDFHGTTSAGDSQTRLASDAEQAEIRQRLNWNVTLAGLKK